MSSSGFKDRCARPGQVFERIEQFNQTKPIKLSRETADTNHESNVSDHLGTEAMYVAPRRSVATHDNVLPSGHLISDRYEIIRKIGKGGMGDVYLATDGLLNDEPLAIKLLHPHYVHDNDVLPRFLREVQLMRRVSHPNVIRIYDFGCDQRYVYYTMEYVNCRTLDELLETDAALEFGREENLISFIMQVCEGLNAIHKANVIHRDIKPENILVLKDGSVRIIDFGVARPEISTFTEHNDILGSVYYIAPEIWLDARLSYSADLYSLGVVLYELVTGKVPFEAGSPAAMMRLHLNKAPVPPMKRNPKVPTWLSDLILSLLAKSPHERPNSMQEVIDLIHLYHQSRN